MKGGVMILRCLKSSSVFSANEKLFGNPVSNKHICTRLFNIHNIGVLPLSFICTVQLLFAGTVVPVNDLFKLLNQVECCYITIIILYTEECVQCNCKTLIMMNKLQIINNYIPTLDIQGSQERSKDKRYCGKSYQKLTLFLPSSIPVG